MSVAKATRPMYVEFDGSFPTTIYIPVLMREAFTFTLGQVLEAAGLSLLVRPYFDAPKLVMPEVMSYDVSVLGGMDHGEAVAWNIINEAYRRAQVALKALQEKERVNAMKDFAPEEKKQGAC